MYRLLVVFYRSGQGHEPVRDWLRELPQADRKAIGEDIKTVQLGWPLGIPVVRKLERDLWEVRIGLRSGIARVLFTIHDGAMVLRMDSPRNRRRRRGPILNWRERG
jgi:phage-related protein